MNCANRLLCAALAGAVIPLALAAGCAKQVPEPEPVGGHADVPFVGWVIMSGDAENPDAEFICQSNPRSECVMPVDRENARVLSNVHLYYHPAATETKYTGSVQLGFFDQPHEIKPDITVKPGASAGNQSVSHFVSSKPGTYAMTIDVVATSTETGQKQNVRDEVRVVVQ